MDVYVNQRVKWPHEFVLAGSSKDRLNYNQLNITQWMARFCLIMREKKIYKLGVICLIISLLYWTIPMIFHGRQRKLVMQYCYEIASWAETEKIDRIRRANAQRHTSGTLPNNGGQKLKKQGQKNAKSMPCVYFNDNSCTFTKYHETKGVFYKHICSYCFAQDGKVSTHSASDCKKSVKND